MSRVLLIRHLPRSLQLQEKDELLRHFGAEKVWEPEHNKNIVLAAFSSHEVARVSLGRLHQLEIGNRRLVVEYSDENSAHIKEKSSNDQTSAATRNMKLFIKELNAWNPSLEFLQPPHPNLRYKYPSANPTVLINIIFSMVKRTELYTQVLHLMNKMSIEPPFTHNEEALHYFTKVFKSYFIQEKINTLEVPSEPESEISSGDDAQVDIPMGPKIVKRKHMLPQTRKRAAAVLSVSTVLQTKKRAVAQKEIFEGVTLQEPKKISLNVPQDSLYRKQEPDMQVIGEITKLVKEPLSNEQIGIDVPSEVKDAVKTISKKELLKNKVSFSDMKILPVFKNYHPGEPSMRLYLKNLAKSVKEEDIKMIYGRYIEGLSSEEQQCFDVRVMQEGRMKGQAFVTFPAVDLAEKALRETNGYLLNDKPMVVQFARASNKKPIS